MRGRVAEDLAAEYLSSRGYEILERNVRMGRGELDLIARAGDVIVFVEVRSRRAGGSGAPEASLSPRKRRLLARTAALWLARRARQSEYCRFDLVAVRFEHGRASLRHIPGAFVDAED